MRRACLLLGIGLIALVLCVPTLARAEEAHASSSDTHQKAAQHQSDEAEQDLFGWALDLGIWTLVVFLLLLFVLSKFAWKPLMQGLEHRERAIHSARQEAEQAREEAARLRAQFEEQVRKANDQARELLDEARRAAERTTAEMIAEARKKIQAEHERIQHEMRLEHDQALRDIQTQAAQLATLVSSKVIRRHLNPDDHRQLVDEALAELRHAGNGRRETALV
ncbi:MAG TPA: F0F1 ATP synthase subunit B [Gemmataceae bacterium]|nr:F0F1 ATP synthase subunit B [Gemmataceae bacterium]